MEIKVIAGINTAKLKDQIKRQGHTQESFAFLIGMTRMGLITVFNTGTTKYPNFQSMCDTLGLEESDLLNES